jgi:hypothetical protein
LNPLEDVVLAKGYNERTFRIGRFKLRILRREKQDGYSILKRFKIIFAPTYKPPDATTTRRISSRSR